MTKTSKTSCLLGLILLTTSQFANATMEAAWQPNGIEADIEVRDCPEHIMIKGADGKKIEHNWTHKLANKKSLKECVYN